MAPPHPAEFRLVAACCAWPPSAERDLAVRTAAEGVDWIRVPVWVRRHRVEGLVHAALSQAGVKPPLAVTEPLAAAAVANARGSMERAAESRRVQRLLDEARISNLVLKGACLDMLAYGGLGLKVAWDIDVLVAPLAVEPALAVLAAAGYRMSNPAGLSSEQFATWVRLAKECVLRHELTGVVVELHWRAVDPPGLLPDICATSTSQTVRLPGGLALRTLAPVELFAYLCVHGATHAWSRLKWLADLAALLAASSEAEIEGLCRDATAMGAGACPALALSLCETILGTPLRPAFKSTLMADPKIRWLRAVAFDAMTGGGGAEVVERPLATERILLSQLLLGDGWRYRLAELRRQWTSVHDEIHAPLPTGLRWLSPLVRPPRLILRRLRRVAAATPP